MDRVELGRSGIKVSRIGLGMWQAGGKNWGKDVNDKDCIAAIRRSVEVGVNLIDTAEVYGDGHSEAVVGKAIAEIGRDNLVIATKVAGYHTRDRDLERACRGSLKRLGIKDVDLYQVHWPSAYVPFRQGFRALERLWREGLIRAIGVSNFAVRDLEEARSHLSRTDIVSNQVRYNLLQREIEAEILPYCRRERISVIAWSPLAQGALAGKYRLGRKPRDAIRKDNDVFTDENLRKARRLLSVLRRIAKAHGRTVAQVALSWLARDPLVVPIPGAKRPAQAEENAGAASLALSRADVRAVDAACRRVRLETF